MSRDLVNFSAHPEPELSVCSKSFQRMLEALAFQIPPKALSVPGDRRRRDHIRLLTLLDVGFDCVTLLRQIRDDFLCSFGIQEY